MYGLQMHLYLYIIRGAEKNAEKDYSSLVILDKAMPVKH